MLLSPTSKQPHGAGSAAAAERRRLEVAAAEAAAASAAEALIRAGWFNGLHPHRGNGMGLDAAKGGGGSGVSSVRRQTDSAGGALSRANGFSDGGAPLSSTEGSLLAAEDSLRAAVGVTSDSRRPSGTVGAPSSVTSAGPSSLSDGFSRRSSGTASTGITMASLPEVPLGGSSGLTRSRRATVASTEDDEMARKAEITAAPPPAWEEVDDAGHGEEEGHPGGGLGGRLGTNGGASARSVAGVLKGNSGGGSTGGGSTRGVNFSAPAAPFPLSSATHTGSTGGSGIQERRLSASSGITHTHTGSTGGSQERRLSASSGITDVPPPWNHNGGGGGSQGFPSDGGISSDGLYGAPGDELHVGEAEAEAALKERSSTTRGGAGSRGGRSSTSGDLPPSEGDHGIAAEYSEELLMQHGDIAAEGDVPPSIGGADGIISQSTTAGWSNGGKGQRLSDAREGSPSWSLSGVEGIITEAKAQVSPRSSGGEDVQKPQQHHLGTSSGALEQEMTSMVLAGVAIALPPPAVKSTTWGGEMPPGAFLTVVAPLTADGRILVTSVSEGNEAVLAVPTFDDGLGSVSNSRGGSVVTPRPSVPSSLEERQSGPGSPPFPASSRRATGASSRRTTDASDASLSEAELTLVVDNCTPQRFSPIGAKGIRGVDSGSARPEILLLSPLCIDASPTRLDSLFPQPPLLFDPPLTSPPGPEVPPSQEGGESPVTAPDGDRCRQKGRAWEGVGGRDAPILPSPGQSLGGNLAVPPPRSMLNQVTGMNPYQVGDIRCGM